MSLTKAAILSDFGWWLVVFEGLTEVRLLSPQIREDLPWLSHTIMVMHSYVILNCLYIHLLIVTVTT